MNINKLKEKNLEQTKLIERIIETLQNNPEKVETVHGFERSEPKYEEYSYFDKIQMPVGVKALYDSCHGLPAVDKFDRFREDGKVSTELYSHPQFFFESWKSSMSIRQRKTKRERITSDASKSTSMRISANIKDLEIKKYSSTGESYSLKIKPSEPRDSILMNRENSSPSKIPDSSQLFTAQNDSHEENMTSIKVSNLKTEVNSEKFEATDKRNIGDSISGSSINVNYKQNHFKRENDLVNRQEDQQEYQNSLKTSQFQVPNAKESEFIAVAPRNKLTSHQFDYNEVGHGQLNNDLLPNTKYSSPEIAKENNLNIDNNLYINTDDYNSIQSLHNQALNQFPNETNSNEPAYYDEFSFNDHNPKFESRTENNDQDFYKNEEDFTSTVENHENNLVTEPYEYNHEITLINDYNHTQQVTGVTLEYQNETFSYNNNESQYEHENNYNDYGIRQNVNETFQQNVNYNAFQNHPDVFQENINYEQQEIPTILTNNHYYQTPISELPNPLVNDIPYSESVIEEAKGIDPRNKLLESIRGKNIQLKKVEQPSPKTSESRKNDVAAILMRRAAMEASDSEDGSDEDWK